MSGTPNQRSLAERAVAALGGTSVLGAGAPPPRPDMPPPEAITARAPQGPATAPSALPVISRATLIAAGGHSMEASRSRCSEEMAVIKHQVLRTLRATAPGGGRNARIIMVTSALPEEGKTFTSLNLAIAIARGGVMPALLVDADGKPDCMSDLLGCSNAMGLRSLAMVPSMPVQPLVHPTEIANLSVLPYGKAHEGAAASIPPGGALAAALRRIADAYPQHVVIVDTPPTLSTSEATALAPVMGQILVVVRAETTQRTEVEAALDMLDACPTLQLVLNQTRNSASDSFGAYGYEVYGAYGRA